MAKIDPKIDTKTDTKTDAKIDTRIDLDAMSIEDLASLRDGANAKLLEKVAARQVELEAEMDRLSQYGKPAKKAAVAAPAAPKAKKNETKNETKSEKKSEETDAVVAEAA